jgi:hypothetical protein
MHTGPWAETQEEVDRVVDCLIFEAAKMLGNPVVD